MFPRPGMRIRHLRIISSSVSKSCTSKVADSLLWLLERPQTLIQGRLVRELQKTYTRTHVSRSNVSFVFSRSGCTTTLRMFWSRNLALSSAGTLKLQVSSAERKNIRAASSNSNTFLYNKCRTHTFDRTKLQRKGHPL